jgi:hypothetical protein
MKRFAVRIVSACAVLVTALATGGVARADVIGQWNAFAQAQTIPIRPTAHGESRGMAMVEGAVYDAVNALQPDYRAYLLDLEALHAQPFGSVDAAIATAAHDVLVTIVPPGQIAAVDAQRDATLSPIPGGPVKAEGIRVGAAAAAAMLAFRMNDGYLAPFAFDIGSDPGDWRPVGWPFALPDPRADPDAWVANEKPFLIASPDQFRTKGPNSLMSRAYEKDFDEVKSVGALNSTTRTADQTAAAVFWQFPPIALWNQLSRDQLAPAFGLGTADQARLYAIVNLAAADAAIGCWNDKYDWSFWRPRAAIREAGADGNPATVGDPSWESLFSSGVVTTPPLGTPPFPDHPSGHSCLSGAVLNALADFLGKDKVEFDIVSGRSLDGMPIPKRHFSSFSDALQEVVDARVWGGIHFRTADEQGAKLGKQVARWARVHYFHQVRGKH